MQKSTKWLFTCAAVTKADNACIESVHLKNRIQKFALENQCIMNWHTCII